MTNDKGSTNDEAEIAQASWPIFVIRASSLIRHSSFDFGIALHENSPPFGALIQNSVDDIDLGPSVIRAHGSFVALAAVQQYFLRYDDLGFSIDISR